ncbi:MAG: hypothetical protein U9R15_06395 [Chloroflexota bacterium]|nr:hypothetical protein [Chloroflexota bacterium]
MADSGSASHLYFGELNSLDYPPEAPHIQAKDSFFGQKRHIWGTNLTWKVKLLSL